MHVYGPMFIISFPVRVSLYLYIECIVGLYTILRATIALGRFGHIHDLSNNLDVLRAGLDRPTTLTCGS